MRFRNMPAIITLTAGLIASVLMIFAGLPLEAFMIRLFIVLIAASIVSLLARRIVNRLLEATKDKESVQEKSNANGENAEPQEGEEDGKDTEKQ